ncbi:MAG TPA: M14 family metallopeptidase [Chryseosolibacter sp.]|nr:M14 family metallopeptidase [Chryseosolibacter sp.]
MKRICVYISLLILTLSSYAFAQPDLSYYLPENITYDSTIPTPKSVIGHEVGEFHITHDRLVNYMYALDKASDRITLEVTGYTHERRPLLLLTVTAPENHRKIDVLKSEHVLLTDPAKSSSLNTEGMPAVFYLGCSIHGNEPSGSNAALIIAYYLAAARGKQIEDQLRNTIILLDPSFNPDGLQRFSSWVNSRKSKVVSADPNDMEHNEVWPGGRTNHYWFDLNRDWLVAQQPESRARIEKFHEWKPNLLTDHHEMGSNATFFFQPGVPSRMHPITPATNLDLTRKIGTYHAKALDAIGSLYYTQEGFDDFYYGKGSTFPDAQGAIGILFEQASSRGHAQETTNGLLQFSFTIRNQFTTALSSLEAVNALRTDLLNYQRQFFKDAQTDAARDVVKAIIVGSSDDKARLFHLAQIVSQHQVSIYKPSARLTINGKTFDPESSFIIPMNQSQYKLIKGMFEKRTSFTDSLFYDISAWTLSLASGLDTEELRNVPALGERISVNKLPAGKFVNGKSDYAYVFETFGYYAPRAMYRLLEQGIRIKVATAPFYDANGKKFERGSIMIPLGGQEKSANVIDYVLDQITANDGIDLYAFNSGLDYKGSSLGSSAFQTVRKPEIAMLVEGGVSASDAGEMWHLFDSRFNIPVTMMPVTIFNTANIQKYNTIIFPSGTYTIINDGAKEKLRTWVQNGGVVIGVENALTWLHSNGYGKFDMKKTDAKKDTLHRRSYAQIEAYQGAQETSGAIFEASADLTHPLLYGYYRATMPVFKSTNLYMERSKNPYGNPVVYTKSPLLSGYISKENYARIRDAAYAGVSALGRGRVIGFSENLTFRAFWFGTNKMLTNAVFFGPLIHESASR